MATTKYTPGPWEVSGTSITAPPCNNDGTCIAVIEDDGGYEAPPEQREANARLIAAAPDLLAALKTLLLTSEWADETGYVEDVGFVNLETVQQQAHAAIAKATGEESA